MKTARKQFTAAFRAKVVGVSVVANVALNTLLIPRFGIMGAAVATQLTYGPTVFLYLRQVSRELNVPWSAYAGYVWKIAGSAMAMLVVVVPVSLLVRGDGIRLAVVSFLGGAVFAGCAWRLGVVGAGDVAVFRAMLRVRRGGAGKEPA